MKVVLYAIVSTDDKEQDPERQLMKERQYAELHEHTILDEIVDYDTGDSNPFKRKQGKHLLDQNPEGIIFYSMDRFTRQHPTKVFTMLNNIKDQGIAFISVTEPIFNSESEFAEVIIFLLTWWNNYFLTKLKRDIKTGMERARAKGKQIGRTPAKFNKDLACILLFQQNKSQREVAKLLNTSVSTINRFKKDVMKNGIIYISKRGVSKSDVLKQKDGGKDR
jgi:DNA invertase Pin-like site-specific DNA recombinase